MTIHKINTIDELKERVHHSHVVVYGSNKKTLSNALLRLQLILRGQADTLESAVTFSTSFEKLRITNPKKTAIIIINEYGYDVDNKVFKFGQWVDELTKYYSEVEDVFIFGEPRPEYSE